MVDKIGEGEQVRLAPLHDRPQKPLYEDGQPGCKRIEQQPKPPCCSAKYVFTVRTAMVFGCGQQRIQQAQMSIKITWTVIAVEY